MWESVLIHSVMTENLTFLQSAFNLVSMSGIVVDSILWGLLFEINGQIKGSLSTTLNYVLSGTLRSNPWYINGFLSHCFTGAKQVTLLTIWHLSSEQAHFRELNKTQKDECCRVFTKHFIKVVWGLIFLSNSSPHTVIIVWYYGMTVDCGRKALFKFDFLPNYKANSFWAKIRILQTKKNHKYKLVFNSNHCRVNSLMTALSVAIDVFHFGG